MAGDEWVSIRLGAVCTKIGSGATPRGGSEVYLGNGPYALIRSQNVYNDGFHHDGLAFIGEKHAAELENVEVLKDDVLLNITGDSVARACQVDPGIVPARVNQHVAIIRPDPKKLDPRFLRYFLVSPEMQVKLLSWAGSGGTRNALTKGMIESFHVLAPTDVSEQRAIAYILGTLDDKIELNRQMNETLEAMARALFKSWFVDFDPVHAKAEGRDPGLPKPIADLFPDSFEDSELEIHGKSMVKSMGSDPLKRAIKSAG
jgi:type I restriction enzyme S subunit